MDNIPEIWKNLRLELKDDDIRVPKYTNYVEKYNTFNSLEKKKDNINKVKNTKTKNTNKRKDNFICFCPYRN